MATAGQWDTLRGVQLHPSIFKVLTEDFGFPTMTPVQAAAIPPLLTCKDVCVEAETGSGKTLSFLVPIAQILLFGRRSSAPTAPNATASTTALDENIVGNSNAQSRRAVRAIVLLPTRELALQVHTVARRLFSLLPSRIEPVPLIGGAAATSSGAGPDPAYASDHRVIVATPGRLAAAVASGALDCTQLDVLVMDEADRLLDMGFDITVTDILTRLPKQRRTGMYSATQTSEVEALARAGMRNPVRVVVRVQGPHGSGEDGTSSKRRERIPASVNCFYDIVSPRDKLAALLQLLAEHPHAKVIVYFLTCASVEYFRRLPLGGMLSELLPLLHNSRDIDGGDSDEKMESRGDDTGDGSVGHDDDDGDDDDDDEGEGEKAQQPPRKMFALHGKMTQRRRERNLNAFAVHAGGVLLCTDVAARGIDIAGVDWVVQFDLPQDPDAYIHRVGRTGRLGRDGRALVFVGEWEDAYVDFLRVRKCNVERVVTSGIVEGVWDEVRKVVRNGVRAATLADRAVLEASEKAFLSFVRAYKEHKCRYLLKLTEVDFNSVGDSFGLLRLPRFYEFKRVRAGLEERNKEGITIRDIGFKDKKREKKRQEDIRKAIANRVERREALMAKSKKKKKKRKKGGAKTNGDEESGGAAAGSGAGDGDMEEEGMEDFSFEALQLRKLKRGKMSAMQFNSMAGYDM